MTLEGDDKLVVIVKLIIKEGQIPAFEKYE